MNVEVEVMRFISTHVGQKNYKNINQKHKNLNYQRNSIYSYGINWDVNQIISFEGKITNGYGSTPSTSLLTIPSDNKPLYYVGANYKPFLEDTKFSPLNKNNELWGFNTDWFGFAMALHKNKIDDIHIHEQIGYELVNMIEEGLNSKKNLYKILKSYLTPMINKNIDCLLLGCTHFNHIKDIIKEMMESELGLIIF